MTDRTIECRSEEGITVGLIDSLIVICRILARRSFSDHQVWEALADLRSDEDVRLVTDRASVEAQLADARAMCERFGSEMSRAYRERDAAEIEAQRLRAELARVEASRRNWAAEAVAQEMCREREGERRLDLDTTDIDLSLHRPDRTAHA